MKPSRDLAEVIDAIVAVEPELRTPLAHARASSLFTAPEIIGARWHQAGVVLRAWSEGVDADRVDRIGRIWSGQEGPKPR